MTPSGGTTADLSGEHPAISIDTNVLSAILGTGELGSLYREFLSNYRAVVTYFVRAEIQVIQWRPQASQLLRPYIEGDNALDPPDESAIAEFVSLKRTAIALGLRYGAEREDLWMLAQTRSADLPVMTHDRNAARVARAAGMRVVTALSDIDEDYARDRRRMAGLRSG